MIYIVYGFKKFKKFKKSGKCGAKQWLNKQWRFSGLAVFRLKFVTIVVEIDFLYVINDKIELMIFQWVLCSISPQCAPSCLQQLRLTKTNDSVPYQLFFYLYNNKCIVVFLSAQRELMRACDNSLEPSRQKKLIREKISRFARTVRPPAAKMCFLLHKVALNSRFEPCIANMNYR